MEWIDWSHYTYHYERDNLVGIGTGKEELGDIKRFFEGLYELEMQEEGVGDHLVTLEAQLHLCRKDRTITLSTKNKVDDTIPERRRLVRYPDHYAQNTRQVLKSLIPGLAQKENVSQALRELYGKQYPKAWWVNSFKCALQKYGVARKVVVSIFKHITSILI
jgi:hypothetical protein